MLPDLLEPFDMSLFRPVDKMPAQTLQMMICESNMFNHQLMWDPKFQSWRLVFAFLPASQPTPPTLFHVA